MRSVMISQTVPLAPGVCIKCSNDHGNRKWFVDLGFDMQFIMHNQNLDGPIYLCDACMNDLFVQYSAQLPQFIKNYETQDRARVMDLESTVERLTKDQKHLQELNEKNQNKIRQLENLIAQGQKIPQNALDALDASIMKHESNPVNIFETKEELENGTEQDDPDADVGSNESIEDAGTDNSSSDSSDSGNVESSEESSSPDLSSLLGSISTSRD